MTHHTKESNKESIKKLKKQGHFHPWVEGSKTDRASPQAFNSALGKPANTMHSAL
jgi:hypothetical protein